MNRPFAAHLKRVRESGDESPVTNIVICEDNVQTVEKGNIHHSTTHYAILATQQMLEGFAGKPGLSTNPVKLEHSGLHTAEDFLPGPVQDSNLMIFQAMRMQVPPTDCTMINRHALLVRS